MTPEQLAKSDAEFEAIIREKYPFLSLKKLPDGSEYLDAYTLSMHKVWSLRQESLVVELPKAPLPPSPYNDGFFRAITLVEQSLQSAGINYREKE